MWHGFKLGIFVLAVVFVLSYSSGDFSSASPSPVSEAATLKVDGELSPLKAAYAVFDVESGEVIVESQAGSVLPIASITKLFTATTLLDRDLTASSTIAYTDVWEEEDFGKLESGQEYVLRELLFPLLLESSNDAAAHFERVTSGGVISDMNALASDIGLGDTKFFDASGLSPKNVSSARDLSKFLSYLYKEQSHVLDITTLPQYVGPYTGWINNSPVANQSGYLGGKHGYTEAAMRTGAFLFAEPISDTTRTISYVVLGSEDLPGDIAKLRDFVHTHVHFE